MNLLAMNLQTSRRVQLLVASFAFKVLLSEYRRSVHQTMMMKPDSPLRADDQSESCHHQTRDRNTCF
jgi:hypothetical protein